jgi:tetratricopeptide (TPR) repeat protein
VQLPLIGRDEELTQLRDALADARGGQGALVEIVGEPGIGKSRLIEELHAELEARVLLATAEAFTSSTPYVIWRQLLRDLLEVGWEADDATVIQKLQGIVIDREPALVPWIPLIGIPLDVDIPLTGEVEQLAEEFRQPKLHEVMGRFLQLTMADETLLHVEDAHLMDGSSAELFTYLLGQIGESRWLVTVTRRQEDTGFVAPGHDRVRVIALEPLPRNEVVTLVEAATEEMPLLPHDVSLVADRAGGNPQFALDLAQVVASGGMLPESIETAAMARIDALAPADRDLVRRTSVLGTSFALRFLPDVLDKDAPSPDNETWKRLGEFFTDDEEGYIRFRRAVVRDAAYTGLPFRTRRSLHARIATRFETEYNPEETGGLLSLHYFLAGSYEEAWGYARTAAVRAADQFANQEAAQLFRRAIDAARRLTDVGPPELAEVYESMARSYLKASEFTAASDAFMAARRHFDGDPIAQARMLHERSKIEETLGRSAQALRWASKAKTMIRDLEAPEALRLAARVSAWYATLLQGLGRLDKADAWCRKAIDEARRSEDLLALAQADYVLGRSALMRGGSGTSLMEEALRIYRQIGDQAGEAQMLVNVGAARYFAGDWSGARAAWVQASELYQVMGDEPSAATGDMNISQVLIDQGRPDEAEPLLRRCVRRFRASGETYALGGSLAQLGRVLARLGRVDEALDVLGDAVTVHDGGGYQAEVLEDESLMAEALVMNERPTEALDRADSAIAAIEKLGGDHVSSSLLQRIRGEAFMQSANWDSARAAFEKSLAIARDRESDFDMGLTLIAMSRLARLTTNDDVAVLERETLEIVQRFEIVAVPTWPVAIAGR